ncbi:MAG: B12-binding domain-containing radical SAM protein [Candidatus Gastranaerophilales bacterium]|nr:B12-binding domain-containing radical SAM protein [Candidatus Gastranaerophilales bacterium]
MSEVCLYKTNKTKQTELNVWCAFPAVYNFGMSALGFLTVFQHIDSIDGIFAERIFTDSEKTVLQPKNVDVIAVSFSFELDYLGILNILKKYKIPFLSSDREEKHPLIYGGGPVLSANPEPFAEFFDFIMIGDAEPNIKEIFELLKNNKNKPKKEQLEIISKIEGVYVPSLKNKSYTVKKAHSDLSFCAATPILTEKSFFPNTYIIEVERGCPQSCAFCLTSYINTPVRFCPYDEIINKIETGIKYTNRLALLGALICAHPRIDDICDYIINKVDSGLKLEVSVSSLRADYVSDKTLEMLRKCGQRTATIAIEGGSERLRQVINKHLSKEDIMNTVSKMVKYGFTGLKLYGIIGLPTETYEDLDAFVDLCKEIKQTYKGFILTLGFSTFIPKAQTPFQFAMREDTKTLEKKNEYMKKQFAKIGIKARMGSAKWDYIQALLSRGSRELTPYLIEVFNQGGTIGAFKSVYKEFEKSRMLKNSDETAINSQSLDKELPWDFIKFPKTKEHLKKEYVRLLGLK